MRKSQEPRIKSQEKEKREKEKKATIVCPGSWLLIPGSSQRITKIEYCDTSCL
jgi:hypothetical protein